MERGAKHILLLSRSGMRTEAAWKTIKKLREHGAIVKAPECDISDASALGAVLKHYKRSMPPFGGCIQASMVLRVRIYRSITINPC